MAGQTPQDNAGPARSACGLKYSHQRRLRGPARALQAGVLDVFDFVDDDDAAGPSGANASGSGLTYSYRRQSRDTARAQPEARALDDDMFPPPGPSSAHASGSGLTYDNRRRQPRETARAPPAPRALYDEDAAGPSSASGSGLPYGYRRRQSRELARALYDDDADMWSEFGLPAEPAAAAARLWAAESTDPASAVLLEHRSPLSAPATEHYNQLGQETGTADAEAAAAHAQPMTPSTAASPRADEEHDLDIYMSDWTENPFLTSFEPADQVLFDFWEFHNSHDHRDQ